MHHGLAVGALEIAVARHGPYGKEFRIAMVAQIKDARKSDGRKAFFVPFSVAALRARQISNATFDGGAVDFAGGHEPEHGPGSLRRRAWCFLIALVFELIA